MGKRTAKAPLGLISPNESVYGTRSRKHCASVSGPDDGTENTPVRSSRRGTHVVAQEKQFDIFGSSNERQHVSASQKRARSSTLTSSSLRSGLRRGNKGSRREESLAGSQTSAPVRVDKGEGFLRDDKLVKNFQIKVTADACSLPGDGIDSGVPEGKAVEISPDLSGCPDEHWPAACRSLDENAVSGEVAAVSGSKAPVAPALQCSLEESGRNPSAGKKGPSMKTYRRRKASRDGLVPNAPVPQEAVGTPRNIVELPSRDENYGMELTEFCRSDEKRAAVSLATDALQNAYDKLYKKYQTLKTRQLAEVDGAFAEQSERIEAYSRAADDLVENLRTPRSEWEHQEEALNRARVMEAAYIECQNDLVMERARNSELREQLEIAELRGSKLVHDLLENTTQLTILDYGKSEIMFSHNQSGYEFKLEQNKLSEDVGGKNALLYSVVSSGTILRVAPDWMRSEIVFDMEQLQVFFQRILAVALCGGVSV